MKKILIITTIFVFILILFSCFKVNACKDIIACGDSTEGNYNLLLKVRDPSRPGLQVLCIVPQDYSYQYHHPWTGKTMDFKTTYKYIGVTTKDDVLPNIVKAGMVLTSAGLCFGDADTMSSWVNPTKHAWDDFDWMRYSCQKADNEQQAVSLLTEEVVDKFHAPGVSENLFIVGPKTGFIVEADAYRYNIKEIKDGIAVMSNYPKELWKTQILKKRPISKNFDTEKTETIKKKGIVHLGSVYGIKIQILDEDTISAAPVSIFHKLLTQSMGVVTEIKIGERKTIGYFSVTLLNIENNKATIQVTNKFKAWEDEMLKHIQPKYGHITETDMMNWSRLHTEDLQGLRPMCEDFFEYEGVAIYKIPTENYETLSLGWFSPNHACSSIYVPFHICDKDIYTPYKTGDAAELSLNLLKKYGHNNLTKSFSKTEKVFQNEIKQIEGKARYLLQRNNDVSDFLTTFDMGMQRQAYLTQEIWYDVFDSQNKNQIIPVIRQIWDSNYTTTFKNIRNAVDNLNKVPGATYYRNKIVDIAKSISKSWFEAAKGINLETSSIENYYTKGIQQLEKGNYTKGLDLLQTCFIQSKNLITGEKSEGIFKEEPVEKTHLLMLYVLMILLIMLTLILILRRRVH